MTAPGPTIDTLFARAEADAFTAALIADCGQPNWPGGRWWILLFLAISALIAAQAVLGNGAELLRPRPHGNNPFRGAPTRVVRPQRPGRLRAPAGRPFRVTA